jgi:hypothetical protein
VNGAGSGDHITIRKQSPNSIDENTAVDGHFPAGKPISTKNRNRRASEGSHLMKGEGKRVSTELRCDQCGKGYKHSSCLTKHMCVYSHTIPLTTWLETRWGRDISRCWEILDRLSVAILPAFPFQNLSLNHDPPGLIDRYG